MIPLAAKLNDPDQVLPRDDAHQSALIDQAVGEFAFHSSSSWPVDASSKKPSNITFLPSLAQHESELVHL
jgi:hypothetical protein